MATLSKGSASTMMRLGYLPETHDLNCVAAKQYDTRGKRVNKQDTDAMMAIIMLADLNLPSDEALRSAIAARLPGVSILADAALGVDGPIMFVERGAVCTIMRFEAPCPMSDKDIPFLFAWYWPTAWEELRGHKAHMIVSVVGTPDARTRATLLGQLTAAAVEATPSSLAVCCADALWPANALPSMAMPQSDAVPTPLVVAVGLSRGDSENIDPKEIKLSARTRGLAAFGLMEIEAFGFAGDLGALGAFVYDLASYLISAGPVIKDGDTIGPDENTKVLVQHKTSHWVPGQKVYHVQFA